MNCLGLSFLFTFIIVSAADSFDCENQTCSTFSEVGRCVMGMCDCVLLSNNESLSCFVVDNTTNSSTFGMCKLASRCANFLEGESRCVQGFFSRLTALLLSIFLINFGAANFYIKRYELAIPQLLIGLLACVFQFGSCGERCLSDEDAKATKSCVFCCGCNAFFSCLVFSWWLADLVIFAINFRVDGDGCPLYV